MLLKVDYTIKILENGYLYKNYITVANINPLNKTITCTDAFHNQRMFKFGDVIEVD
ncbi:MULTISPECIES: YolD-like family protein [Bacillus cereus group]|uniref:YolD-like family protein n=1 Tax=Bacillus cereus group TaxID=86661 RepID=UPI0020D24AA0|nr:MULTISPECIES: YolD-like family protein [Bacillus cereus group]MED2918971.1 YolD-like family protein [Bacillus thuringiensis]MED2920522.1 YolD-like family protein [Bacillus thuringiensis]MED3050119.1 YolD-like family protein [Bacillus thuringiensis]